MEAPIFDGLLVIDCASYIAGPAAATVMSDFGASVVKIEPPGAGDPYRVRAGRPALTVAGRNPNWLMDARNKRSLALDLSNPAGQAVLHRLAAQADVFITNYPPPVRRRLRVAWEDIGPLNPRLIYASFTGYGETGPEADKPGFDVTAWWARSGLMHLVRAGEASMPARSLSGMGDHPSAMGLFGAIATALYRRERTGKGGLVGSSLLANGFWANANQVQTVLCGEPLSIQPPPEAALHAMRNHYCCRDGRWIILAVVPSEARWRVLADVLGGGLSDDPRFATEQARAANMGALNAAMAEIFLVRDFADWRARLDAAGLVFGIVAAPDDIRDDAQARAAGVVVPFADGSMETVSSPFWLEGQQKLPPRHAPEVGEHSAEVLRDAGFAEDEIAALRQSGVVG
ncbi:MAG: CoA transferase [Proteobacteria bacterium]|nr:CoA transferase [Pseudomonadota bacterium]